ncbi:hypothetical protein [Streptomyces sp. NPDC059994]|uniref:hypothetical protein n=1 Tax=Streptomyces sp. NPDC059994 TaxID=3347029 RepID=UPI0036CD432B
MDTSHVQNALDPREQEGSRLRRLLLRAQRWLSRLRQEHDWAQRLKVLLDLAESIARLVVLLWVLTH